MKFKNLILLFIFVFLQLNFYLYPNKSVDNNAKIEIAKLGELYRQKKYAEVIERIIGSISEESKPNKELLRILKKAGQKLKKEIEEENRQEASKILKMVLQKFEKKKEILKRAEEYRARKEFKKALIVLNSATFYDDDIERLKEDIKKALEREKKLEEKRKRLASIVAKKSFEMAKKFYNDGYYLEAVRLLKRALSLKPDFKEAEEFKLLYEKKFLFWKNNYGKENPFYFNLKTIFEKAIDAYLKDDWEIALKNFEKVEEMEPSPEVYEYINLIKKKLQSQVVMKEVEILYSKGDLEGSYKKIEEIKNAAGDNIKFIRLSEEIETALEIKKIVEEADIAKSNGSYLKAVELYQKALSYNSDYMKDEIEEKIKSLAKMRRNAIKDKSLMFLYNELYNNPYKKDFVKRVKEVLKEKEEKKRMEFIKRIKEYERKKKLEEERKRKERIARKLKNAKEYYANRQFERAYNLCKEILKMDPQNTEAKEILNKTEKEVKKLEKLKNEAVKKSIEKHYKQGLVYYTQGRYKDAIFEWKKVLELDPNNDKALKNIKTAEMKLGEK